MARTSVRKKTLPPPPAPCLDSLGKLTESVRRGELVCVIGTGFSLGLTDNKYPTLAWRGLIEHGLGHGQKKGLVTPEQADRWKSHLESPDLDDLLGAAEFMGRKLGSPNGDLYARWLEGVFANIVPSNAKMEAAVRGMVDSGIPICTLNYDTLLERVSKLSSINITERSKVTSWMRKEYPGILHLHGVWDSPASCILGIRDYETTLGNDSRDLIQRSLGVFRRLLFIGCGETFSDPNFSALITWLRQSFSSATLEHYALVSSADEARRHSDSTWHGFVEPLSYGLSHSELPEFLLKIFPESTMPRRKTETSRTKSHALHSVRYKLLQDYRAFLIKDCGQMTIEGVRADMDTAQRRFDLEHLFVPLNVLPCPPEIPATDPQREKKLQQWHENNKKPSRFGDVFAEHTRIALLALPGGGKTLLLKRLAVAYADDARRDASSDDLPDLPLTPVLIRCREWQEHIHRPIAALLDRLSDITGQPSLVGLYDALVPLFKKGQILLLVDGLDEIHDDGLRSTFVENLERFLETHSKTRIVVTSREAGFNLVAPSLARFCERRRLAPLEPSAITMLCTYWHRLMSGNSIEAEAEARDVSELLLRNESLRRLAENPLLLTMLLVVKRGAGRLPPDRVSLYSRAVEVLLDTWNIKGHAPLNTKEAVPQLAFVAFELMCAGKQTATEKEWLGLIEKARDEVPQIHRYAKDSPYQFLRRVELRSSLIVEVGRQAEGGGTVPVYQFRHLTFQEYLAAVAAVEGHYVGYEPNDIVAKPLEPFLTAEKWKEVIPMAAVLARKQSEPLMGALAKQGEVLRAKIESGESSRETVSWMKAPERLPVPVARLFQCLVEEAEAGANTLTSALQLVAFFGRGCRPENDWRTLSRGPYGEELWHQSWELYSTMTWPRATWMRNTCAAIAAHRISDGSSAFSTEQIRDINRLLSSRKLETIGRGLFACSGLLWNGVDGPIKGSPKIKLERHIFHENPALQNAAIWAWIYLRVESNNKEVPSRAILDQILSAWLEGTAIDLRRSAAYALCRLVGLPRNSWTPDLTEVQLNFVRSRFDVTGPGSVDEFGDPDHNFAAAWTVAFHGEGLVSDSYLAELAVKLTEARPGSKAEVLSALQQMGAVALRSRKKLGAKE